MKLVDVEFEDFMLPCFAYVMKRTGLNMSYNEFRKLEEKTYISYGHLDSGTILRWDNNNGENNWQQYFLTIKYGKVIATWINCNIHYGVYEGNGLVSDLVVGDDKNPYIRIRELDKLYNQPRGFIVI